MGEARLIKAQPEQGWRRPAGMAVIGLAALLAAACQTTPIAPSRAGATPGGPARSAHTDGAAAACAAASETDPATAEPLCRKAAADAAAQLGEKHPVALSLKAHLATALLGLGRAEEAVAPGRAAVIGLAASLGPWHRDTEGARQVLLAALADAGQPLEALRFAEETLRLSATGDGMAGLSRAYALRERAHLLRGLGRWQEAVPAYEAARDAYAAALGASQATVTDLRNWIEAARHAAATTAKAVSEGKARPIDGEFRGQFGIGCMQAAAAKPESATGGAQGGCLRLGIVRVGDAVATHERALGTPFQTMAQPRGSEARLYALGGTRLPAPYLVLEARAGRVEAVQITGRQRPGPVGLSSVFLGDFEPALFAMLGEPFVRKPAVEGDRELWLYGPDDVSFELKRGRIVSMRVGAGLGATPPRPSDG